MRKALFTLVLLSLLSSASALLMPTDMKTDPRIKTVMYVPHQIIPLTISNKVLTQIKFSDDEQIIQVVFGDLNYHSNWPYLIPKNVPNVLFLGTTLTMGETNVTVITNERTYYFDVSKKADESSDDITYSLVFRYPQDNLSLFPHQSLLTQALADKADLNYQYRYSGSQALKPVRVFDNGSMTFVTFSPHAPLPSIENVMDSMGQEQLTNTRTEGHTLIIMGTGAQYTFRQGGVEVGSIFNEKSLQTQTPLNGQQNNSTGSQNNTKDDPYPW